ncbi:MAG: hypothetical protein U0625_07335 [Phycisphaerales bacterium]
MKPSIRRASIPLLLAGALLGGCAYFTPVKQAPPESVRPPIDGTTGAARTALWRADIDQCQRLLQQKHAGLYTFVTPAQFDADFDALRRDLPTLRDDQVVVRLKQITTRIGSGHTGVWPSRGELLSWRLPVDFRWDCDGVVVAAADPTAASVRGGVVTAIGGKPIGAVLEAIATVTPHENQWYLRFMGARSLREVQTLSGLGIVPPTGPVAIAVRFPDGREATAQLQPIAPGAPYAPQPAVDPAKAAVTRVPRPEARACGSRMLEEPRILYVWYDRCADAPGMSVAQFARETLQAVDATRPRAVVVDLRRNGGGNSRLLEPLIDGLAARAWINAPDRLFVLIGPATFSSAGLNAEQFRSRTRASLVGEPTGQRPDSWMESRYDWLDNSLMQVTYMLVAPDFGPQTPVAVVPDIPVPVTVADDLAGRDAALDRILAATRAAPAP